MTPRLGNGGMVGWRDKQSKDYELPSDLDKLDEIRRRHLGSREASAEPESRAERRVEGGGRRRGSVSYFLVLAVVVLGLMSVSGFVFYEQQKGFDRRVEALEDGLGDVERELVGIQEYLADVLPGFERILGKVEKKTEEMKRTLDKLEGPSPVPIPAPVVEGQSGRGQGIQVVPDEDCARCVDGGCGYVCGSGSP